MRSKHADAIAERRPDARSECADWAGRRNPCGRGPARSERGAQLEPLDRLIGGARCRHLHDGCAPHVHTYLVDEQWTADGVICVARKVFTECRNDLLSCEEWEEDEIGT